MARSAKTATHEPNYETACGWWSDIRDIWTPVGWKNHLFRYDVFWNGMILAQPKKNRRTEAWAGQGVQVVFQCLPTHTAADLVRHGDEPLVKDDNGMTRQSWVEGAAPVLRSQWYAAAASPQQDVFAHVLGGEDVQTGIEPLFAWVRLSIGDQCEALPQVGMIRFVVRIFAPHISTSMTARANVIFDDNRSKYPRTLAADAEHYSTTGGLRLVEPDGTVRLAVAPGQACRVLYAGLTEDDPAHVLNIDIDNRKGRHADLLLPMLPTPREPFDAELKLGYDAALRQANRYWSRTPRTAARVQTPEPAVQEVIKHSLRLSEIVAEKNPADGQYSMLTGSFTYANLWATPHAMGCAMLLDALGYHEQVDRYMEIFRDQQGTVVPPGDCFTLHPGYLSSPKSLTSVDWLSDHGALLYIIANHALVTADGDFIRRWTDPLVKACQFIADARRITGHGGVEGVMPPAVATDNMTKIQGVWVDGWNHLGLVTAVRLLKRLGHPLAAEFDAQARDYRQVFQEALAKAAARYPTWTDRRGRKQPFVPPVLSQASDYELRHAFHLDTGPMFAVFGRLMPANHPLMKAAIAWFREGPPRWFYRYNGNCWQLPSLQHEISSCEPIYSWNVFHSHELGDRLRYAEGLYSLLAGMVSRQTFVSCETRGGITGIAIGASLPIYMIRLAMVDDQIKPGELHLLRMMPLAWLKPGEQTAFEKMPTEFGPVTIKTKRSGDGKTLRVGFDPKFHVEPKRIVLHIPPADGLMRITVNGKVLRRPRGTSRLALATR